MTPPTLETERLVLRPWRDADEDAFAAMCGDEAVMRFISDGRPYSPVRTRAAFHDLLSEWAASGFGSLAVVERQSCQVIGMVGLARRTNLPDVAPAVEIGWRFALDAWGQGYATEAAGALLDFARHDLGLSDLISVCHVDNRSSVRIMQKLGFRLDRQTMNPSAGCPVSVFRLDGTGSP